MKFTESSLKGAFVVDVEPHADDRGLFARAWCAKEFTAQGLNPRIVQANLSYNRSRGTVRGLHYQVAPYEEAKLVRCVRGAIYDVIVDLRPDSPTYLQWAGIELTADNRRMLYVPEGFAHGFQTLEDDSDVFYQVTQYYTPGFERGIRWDDAMFKIAWPDVPHRVISDKDRSWSAFGVTRATS
jgi:dTDP-4-dehydrorhamnose 3,5-epimerase